EFVLHLIQLGKFLTSLFHFLLMLKQQVIDFSPALTAAVYGDEQYSAKGHHYNEDVSHEFTLANLTFLERMLKAQLRDFRIFGFSFKLNLISQKFGLLVCAEYSVFRLFVQLIIFESFFVFAAFFTKCGKVFETIQLEYTVVHRTRIFMAAADIGESYCCLLLV